MNLIQRTYEGQVINFDAEGWIDATSAAQQRGRRIDHWLKTQETKEYIAVLCEITNTPEKGYLKTKRGVGGGTWLHPKLGVPFARWLDPRFSVWCDAQIDNLIRGQLDVKRVRHECAATYKVVSEILQQTRAEVGKPTEKHHYANEARLINWVLTGEFKSINRDELNYSDLDLLAKLESRDAVLIARGYDYQQRKSSLLAYADDIRPNRLVEVRNPHFAPVPVLEAA